MQLADLISHPCLPDAMAKCAEFGYWVGVAHWGKGVATRALREGCVVAKERGFHRLDGSVFGENAASSKVLEKCGFVMEGRSVGAYIKDGIQSDALYYGKIL